MAGEESITGLRQRFADGDKTSFDRLMPLVYAELQRLAGGYLRNERSGHTLQPTALVHEAYARLLKQEQPDYRSRSHFMGVAAQVMRQIRIDHARSRQTRRRKRQIFDRAGRRNPGPAAIHPDRHRRCVGRTRPQG